MEREMPDVQTAFFFREDRGTWDIIHFDVSKSSWEWRRIKNQEKQIEQRTNQSRILTWGVGDQVQMIVSSWELYNHGKGGRREKKWMTNGTIDGFNYNSYGCAMGKVNLGTDHPGEIYLCGC